MLVLGPLGPGGHDVGEAEAMDGRAPFRDPARRVADLLVQDLPAREIVADVVEVQVHDRRVSARRPVLGGRVEGDLDLAAVQDLASHELTESLVEDLDHVAIRSARPMRSSVLTLTSTAGGHAPPDGSARRPTGSGPRRRRRKQLSGNRSGNAAALTEQSFLPSGPPARPLSRVRPERILSFVLHLRSVGDEPHAATTCRPASTSRRSRPAPARSRASGPPSRPSSAWLSEGPPTRPCWSRTGPSSHPRSVTSWRVRTSPMPSTATS